jgi:hypothetical protein
MERRLRALILISSTKSTRFPPSSPTRKNIPLLPDPKSPLQLPPSCPAQRGVGRRHDEGQVAVDAAASGACGGRRAGLPVSGRNVRTTGVEPGGVALAKSGLSRTAKPCGPGIRC